MDFKANLNDIATICKKIENNTSALTEEINNSKKIVESIPTVWNDNGSKLFIEKYLNLLKKIQSLAKVYESITLETNYSLNKYEEMDATITRKIQTINSNITGLVDPVVVPTVYRSKKYDGEYYVCRFNESTGKNEYFPAPKDFGKENLNFDGSGGKLVIRKYNKDTGKYMYIDSPTRTIPEDDIEVTLVKPEANDLYFKYFDEKASDYKYIPAPAGFDTGEVKIADGVSLVSKKLNDNGSVEYIEVYHSDNNQGGK